MATVAWLGGAPAVPKVLTHVPTDTTVYTLLMDGSSDIVITFSAGPGVPAACKSIRDAINGNAISQGETERTGTGATVGEFSLLRATLDDETTPTLVWITGPADGRPFTLTLNAVSGTTIQTQTGPHHFDNTENWSSGTVPVDDDVLLFDERAVSSLKYAIDLTGTRYEATVTQGFKHEIGLADVYQANNALLNFDETLPKALTFDDPLSGGADIQIGQGTGVGSSLVRITVVGQANFLVAGSGSRKATNIPPVLLIGGASSSLVQTGGDIAVGYYETETATLATVELTGDTSRLEIGGGCSLATLTMDAGTVRCRDLPSGNIDVYGGVFYCQFTGSGAEIHVSGGAVVDFTEDPRARTFTKIILYKGAAWIDPQGSVTSTALELHGTKPNEVTISAPSHRKWTIAAI